MSVRRRHSVAASSARPVWIPVFLLALCGLLALNVWAFNSSLQPEEVQEAYSLGQTTNHEELADFLKQYEHDFQYPSDQPVAYVQSVEFQTPYEQIVLRTLRTIGYSKFQAQEDYRAHPNRIFIRAIVALRMNYAGPVPLADSFQVVVSQSKSIEPKEATSKVTCDPYSHNTYSYPMSTDCLIYTREILLQFDARQFGPGKTTVTVALPGGQSLVTKYDLDKLK